MIATFRVGRAQVDTDNRFHWQSLLYVEAVDGHLSQAQYLAISCKTTEELLDDHMVCAHWATRRVSTARIVRASKGCPTVCKSWTPH